jgi:hypothetical protein
VFYFSKAKFIFLISSCFITFVLWTIVLYTILKILEMIIFSEELMSMEYELKDINVIIRFPSNFHYFILYLPKLNTFLYGHEIEQIKKPFRC